MKAVTEARKGLAYALGCTQCGRRFSERACGPTHAVLAVSPEQHRLVAPLIEEAAAKARATALEEAGQLVRDHVLGKVDAGEIAHFLDTRAARVREGVPS